MKIKYVFNHKKIAETDFSGNKFIPASQQSEGHGFSFRSRDKYQLYDHSANS